MNKFVHNGNNFRNTDDQLAQIREWKPRHWNLVDALGKIGTLVRVDITNESDQDIPPYSFVRRATHEFVFPPQEVTLKEDLSRVIDNTSGYGINRKHITYNLSDPEAAKGALRVHYADADSRVVFSVEDMMEESELPIEALAAIATAQLAEVQPS